MSQATLSLVTLPQRLLRLICVIAILLVGIILLRKRFAVRAITIGAAAIVVVLLAVFFWAFTVALVCDATIGAAFVVLVIWVLWYLLVTFPPSFRAFRQARLQERLDRRQAESPPESDALPEHEAETSEAKTSEHNGGSDED